MGRHLPYGITVTQCYLPPDTSEPQPVSPELDLPTPELRDGKLSCPKLPGNATVGVELATSRSHVRRSNSI